MKKEKKMEKFQFLARHDSGLIYLKTQVYPAQMSSPTTHSDWNDEYSFEIPAQNQFSKLTT